VVKDQEKGEDNGSSFTEREEQKEEVKRQKDDEAEGKFPQEKIVLPSSLGEWAA